MKKLQVLMPSDSRQLERMQNTPAAQNGMITVHEYCRAPLSANHSSRYSENVSHHPQYQTRRIMHGGELFGNNEISASVSNTSFLHQANCSNIESNTNCQMPMDLRHLQTIQNMPSAQNGMITVHEYCRAPLSANHSSRYSENVSHHPQYQTRRIMHGGELFGNNEISASVSNTSFLHQANCSNIESNTNCQMPTDLRQLQTIQNMPSAQNGMITVDEYCRAPLSANHSSRYSENVSHHPQYQTRRIMHGGELFGNNEISASVSNTSFLHQANCSNIESNTNCQMPTDLRQLQTIQNMPSAQNGMITVDEYCRAPLSANHSSRYSENVSHHPQYQTRRIMHGGELFGNNEISASVSNTSFLHQANCSNIESNTNCQMPTDLRQLQTIQNMPSAQNGMITVDEYCRAPLSANHSSRYSENVSHHPQYQTRRIMHGGELFGNNEISASVSNTSFLHQANCSNIESNTNCQMPTDLRQLQTIQNMPSAQNGMITVHEYCRAPLSANHSSRYSENVSHHPQYQTRRIMHGGELFGNNEISASASNNSFLQQANCSNIESNTNCQMPTDLRQLQTIQNMPSAQNGMITVHEYCRAPLSANHSSRYSENLSHHPQYQTMQIMHGGELYRNDQISASASNYSFLQQANCSNIESNSNYHLSPNAKNVSQKNNTYYNDYLKFKPYMSKEEVEIRLQNNNTLVEGVLSIYPNQHHYSFVSITDRNMQDIFIKGVKNRNRALEGDVVVVQYLEGYNEVNKLNGPNVVYIKKKNHNRTCIGVLLPLKDKNMKQAVLVPTDRRIPNLCIPFANCPANFYEDSKSYENTLFLAQIEHWRDIRFAMGRILCVVGKSGDMQSEETKAILTQTDLNITPFGPDVQYLYPRLDAQNVNDNVLSRQPVNQNNYINDKGDKKFSPYMSKEEVDLYLQDNNTLVEGVLRINRYQFQHSYISSTNRCEHLIFIDGIRNRNRALEGDVVVVQYIESDNEENKVNTQKKAKVVYIKEKVHNRTCIGVLKQMPDKNSQWALFIPRDSRIPKLNIPFTNWPDNFYEDSERYENTLFKAKIDDWYDISFAMGTLVELLGESGDMETETRAILTEADLDITPFGPDVRHLYPRLDYTIPIEEYKLREDCRKMCIFSIDPFNCRDIDDAVSCQKLYNGNYEVGVHISDVAHFLTANTVLDEMVAKRATTIYLVDRAYHMLPEELCILCSLFPGVDKLAFSVFWEMTEDAKIVKHRFTKTIINSCSQLAYDHVQAILDNSEDAEKSFPVTYNGFTFKDIQQVIKVIGKLSATLRSRRSQDEALRIDKPEVSFQLSPPNGLPEPFGIYDNKESHQLIQELMLLANMTVTQRIYEHYPKLALLMCHPSPRIDTLEQLATSLKSMEIHLEFQSAGKLYKSLLPSHGNEDFRKAMVLNMLCAEPMTRAKYFCIRSMEEDYQRCASNVPLYTHFTSPIRRYADIMVHRLLAASLNYGAVPKWEVNKVCMVAARCNKQKYNAKKAGFLANKLHKLKYIELNSPLVKKAVVVEIREKYIDVIVVGMGLKRRIFFNNDFPGEYKCIKNDAGENFSKMELTWKATYNSSAVKQVIELSSILQVEMHKGDGALKIETQLVRPQ